MKMNKVKIMRSIINGTDALIVITLKPDGKKINMTIVYPDAEGYAEVIIADNGFVAGKDEPGYEDYEKIHEDEQDK